MPVERIAMRDVHEIVRLRMAGLSTRQVGIRVGVAASTVRMTLRRLEAAGLDGPGALALPEAALESRLFDGAAGKRPGHRRVDEPDWAQIRRELQRKHVTLSILWDEYIAEHPDGYRYSAPSETTGWLSA
ncbi:hypothetical protein AiwAL_17365 [Acidiphilium sp. AL]|nr:hypothetical protein [Acidiphilium sp. AL]